MQSCDLQMTSDMSASGSSDEFSYQTRLVVYNFLGLVPATPSPSDDELENSVSETVSGGKPRLSWNDALETLPPVSLFDRLSESEVQQMQMKMVCDEVTNKVKLVEPVSSSSESPFKPKDDLIEKDKQFRKKSGDRFDYEANRQDVLTELKQNAVTRGLSPNNLSGEEALPAPITIIQKKNRFKILGDSITASEEADICRRLSLQPFSASSKLSDEPGRRSSSRLHPQSALVGGLGNRPFFPRRPTTLLSSSGLTSSREFLTQIDEDHELNVTSEMSAEDGPSVGKSSEDQDILVPTTPGQNFTSRPSVFSASRSFERQTSSSSRRCSTYVDITEVDVENLIKSKALPPVTLPLKRELSIAFEQLEKDYKSGDDVDEIGANDARSPESEVADSLRALGDRIQEEYGSQLGFIVQDLLGESSGQSVSYYALQNATSQLLQETHHGWTQVTLVMLLGQHVIYELLRRGCSRISHLAEFTAKLVEDHAADFIVNSGGWDSVGDIGVVETETIFTPLDVDSGLFPKFDSDSVSVESPSAKNGSSESPKISTSRKTIVLERPPDFLDSRQLDSSYSKTDRVESDSMESSVEPVSSDTKTGDSLLPSPLMTSTPPGLVRSENRNIEGEILLLRQNSQQYVDEMEAARRTVVWTQSGAIAGLVLMVVLASWIIYRRIRRTT